MTDQEKLLNLADALLNNSLKLKNKINHLSSLDRKIIILSEERDKMLRSILKLLDQSNKTNLSVQNELKALPERELKNLPKELGQKINQITDSFEESIHQLKEHCSRQKI